MRVAPLPRVRMKSAYAPTKPLPRSELEVSVNYDTYGWQVQWTTCLPLTLASAVGVVTMVLAAILVSRVPDDLATTAQVTQVARAVANMPTMPTMQHTHDTCDIYFNVANSVTRLEVQELTLFGTGIFGVPTGADCACPGGNSQAVYLAPRDLCHGDNFPHKSGAATPSLCRKDPLDQLLYDHVLVCIDDAAIDRLWDSNLCKTAEGYPDIHKGRLTCPTITPAGALLRLKQFVISTNNLFNDITNANASMYASNPTNSLAPTGLLPTKFPLVDNGCTSKTALTHEEFNNELSGPVARLQDFTKRIKRAFPTISHTHKSYNFAAPTVLPCNKHYVYPELQNLMSSTETVVDKLIHNANTLKA